MSRFREVGNQTIVGGTWKSSCFGQEYYYVLIHTHIGWIWDSDSSYLKGHGITSKITDLGIDWAILFFSEFDEESKQWTSVFYLWICFVI